MALGRYKGFALVTIYTVKGEKAVDNCVKIGL